MAASDDRIPRALEPAFEGLNLLGPIYWGDKGLKNAQTTGVAAGTHRAVISAITSGKAQIVAPGSEPETEETSVSTSCDYVGSEGDEPENEDDAEVAEEFDHLRLEDATIRYSAAFVEELAAREIPAATVVLSLPPLSWRFKPPQWYDAPPERGDALPRLSSRKYIKVVFPFEEVELSAKAKGAPLTVEDVLFASRALMADARRNIPGGFALLQVERNRRTAGTPKQSFSRLVLQPWLDNCST